MTDENTEKNQSEVEDRETVDNREEREYRRINEDNESVKVSDNRTDVDESPVRPDQEGSDGNASAGKDEEQLGVPQIGVTRTSRLYSTKQAAEQPSDDWTIQIPQIETRFKATFDARGLGDSVIIGSEESALAVPHFTPSNTEWLTPSELDNDPIEALNSSKQIKIPQIEIRERHFFKPFSSFVETCPEVTVKKTDTAVGTDLDEKSKKVDQTATDTVQTSGEAANDPWKSKSRNWSTDDFPDPLDLLFTSDGAKIKSKNPLVILTDDDILVGIVETLVKRRYREIEGGEPELQKFNTANQLVTEERWLSADSQIFTAQLSDEEWEKLEGEHQEKWQSIWRNRLNQLFSGQRFGAIIFNRSKIPDPEVTSSPVHHPILVEIEIGNHWEDIGRIFWSDFDSLQSDMIRTFSQVFDRDVHGIAQDRWKQIRQAKDGKFTLATEHDETESDEHYALKLFIVEWFVEHLWESGEEFTEYDKLSEIENYLDIEDVILTEEPIVVGEGNSVIPDIRHGSRVFEAETFFGEVDESEVLSKLKQTVRKYEGVVDVNEINIVVDNLTCLLHLKDLAQFKRNHRHWEKNNAEVNFYTVDLGQKELVPLAQIVERLKSC